jgi:hypothetical protein
MEQDLSDEGTASLIWYQNEPWKRTIVYRDPVPHYFQSPHPDFLEQTVEYRWIKSYYYQVGLTELTEGFLLFNLMVLVTQ